MDIQLTDPIVTVVRVGPQLMEEAREWAKSSVHERSKVGCALIDVYEETAVGGMNYNPHPRIPDTPWIHAEVSALVRAAKLGVETNGASMAVNWFPCLSCAALIKLAGIRTLYYDKAKTESRWDDPKYNFQASYDYLIQHDIELVGL